MNKTDDTMQADLAPEYDFSKGRRGKYSAAFHDGTNLIAIEPDLLRIFPDSEAVNRALRSVAEKHRPSAK